nr:GNAT family N-acetyltransferase [uncultured Merdimonas sp.]
MTVKHSFLPEYQRKGIGTALIKASHKTAKEVGYGYSVVLGSETYYPRASYVPADTFGIFPPLSTNKMTPLHPFRYFRASA